MITWEVARRRVAIAGQVADAATGRAIAGALIQIASAPDAFVSRLSTWARLLSVASAPAVVRDARAKLDDPGASSDERLRGAQIVLDYLQAALGFERLDVTHSSADGHFHYLDLPEGQYSLVASYPGGGTRYGSATGQATVARNGEGLIVTAALGLPLPPTGLRGQVTSPAASPVPMAAVRVLASGERAFTDSQGRYLLTGLEVGDRKVVVSARGFQDTTRTVSLRPTGSIQSLDVSLATATP